MAITVDGSTTFQTMAGFGGADAFAIGQSPLVADFLWRQDTGIGLSLLREKISPNGFPTSHTQGGGSYPTSIFEMDSGGSAGDDTLYTVATQANARGARVWGTIWAFPTVWQGGSANGALQVAHYGDGATLLTDYVDQAWALGVPIWYIGMCNEPDITPGYPQTSWTTAQAISFIKNNLFSSLDNWASSHPAWQTATGLPRPGIMLPQTSQWAALATWINAVEGDSTALSETALYATHQYDASSSGGGSVSVPPTPTSRPIWQTEVFDQNDAYDTTMTQALTIAQYIHNAIVTGNVSAWHYWFNEDVSDNNNSGLVGTNAVNWTNPPLSIADWNAPTFPKRAYMLGQFAKFVRPGYTRVSVSGVPGNVFVTAYALTTGTGAFAIVAINTNGADTAVTFNLTGLPPAHLSVTPWVTDATRNLQAQAPISIVGGSFSPVLPANSVVTYSALPSSLVRAVSAIRGL